MSVGGRGRVRERVLRRTAIAAAILVLLALLLLFSGHWILGIIFAIAAVIAVWAFQQARSVR
jgi:hypothetical protein